MRESQRTRAAVAACAGAPAPLRSAAAALIAAYMLGVPVPAAADDAQTQAAEALFRQAKALMQRGELEEACEKFAASHALEPGLGTLLFLGDCYERSGRFASALQTFQQATKLAGERDDESRAHLASVRAKALGPRVPRLQLESGDSPPDNLHITVNGAPFDSRDFGRAVPRDQGEYEIRFSAPGRETFVAQIRLKNGATSPTVVEVPRLVAVTRPARALESREAEVAVEPEVSGDTQRVWAWVMGGAGVALAISSGVLTALAASANDDSKASCDPDNPNLCDPDGVRLREDAKNMAKWATVAGVAGGVAIAGGIVLYVSAPSGESGLPESAFVGVRGRF